MTMSSFDDGSDNVKATETSIINNDSNGNTIQFPKIYAGRNIKDSDLSDKDLSAAIFGGAKLKNIKCTNTSLFEADLGWSTLTDVDFSGSDLRKADLRGASLDTVNLSDSDLRGADFSGASLHDVVINETTLIDNTLKAALLDSDDTQTNFDRAHSMLCKITKVTTNEKVNAARNILENANLAHMPSIIDPDDVNNLYSDLLNSMTKLLGKVISLRATMRTESSDAASD